MGGETNQMLFWNNARMANRFFRKKVGELTMENELLQEKAQRLEAGLPLAHRRSRR